MKIASQSIIGLKKSFLFHEKAQKKQFKYRKLLFAEFYCELVFLIFLLLPFLKLKIIIFSECQKRTAKNFLDSIEKKNESPKYY